MGECTITFGKRDKNLKFKSRKGAYAIIRDARGRFLTIKWKEYLYLVGGGIDNNETPIDALHREVLEETGYTIKINDFLGVAENHFTSKYYPDLSQHNLGYFYHCSLQEKVAVAQEKEPMVWATLEELEENLFHAHQLYMVKRI